MNFMALRLRTKAQFLLRLILLVMLVLQITSVAAVASKNVYVRWGTDTYWQGDGGTVSSTGRTVQNKSNISPKPGDTATLTFTITPDSGYVIKSVQWKSGDDNGFGSGGTDLTPNSSGQVTFTLKGDDASLQVMFQLDPNVAHNRITAYYGSNTFDFTAANKPDWTGGTVSVNDYTTWGGGAHYTPVGTSSYTTYDFSTYNGGWDPNNDTVRFKVIPNNSPAYTVTSIQYAEVTWNDPRTMTFIGPWNTINYDASGVYTITNLDPAKCYVIFVKFTPVGAVGGNVGAWYGTNNITDYDTPNANGSGGTVWKTSPGSSLQLANRAANGVTITTNTTATFEVRPATGYKISSIMYGDTIPNNSVTVPANQTTNLSFSFGVSGGHTYIIWVVFTSTAASSFTVTGSVDPTTDPLCTSNDISPPSATINLNQTGSFSLSTSTNCTIDCVNFNNGGCNTWIGPGTTFTTDPIDRNSTFTVKFKPIGYTIDAFVDESSPAGCGGISPAGTVAKGTAIQVAQAGSQTFTITTNTGCSVSHVYVTDANQSWTNHDLVPMAGSTYTFSNVHANGSIKVVFVPSVPASGLEYCQIPPFVQGRSDLIPNVLIIFDNSGSMGGNDSDGFAYYNNKSYGCTASGGAAPTLGVGACTKFDGYFDPTKMYKTDTTNANVYLIDNVTQNLSSTNGKSGNYLNWRNMHKVDIIRKVLVGGRVTDKGTSTLAGANRGTLAKKYLYTDNGKWVEYGTTEPQGLVQQYSDRVRFGLEVFGSTSSSTTDGGTIVAQLGSPIATLVGAIEGPKTNPTTNTPMAEAIYEAVRYFQAKPSAYNSNTDYSDGTWNPAGNPIIQYPCQKHFVLLLTDGEANSTDKLPGLTNPTLNGYSDGVLDVKTWSNRIPSADQPTTSDGKYTDAVAYYAHVTDLRSDAYDNDMLGNQYLTFYTVYAFGDGSGTKTLKTLAKYGGFESKNGNDAGTDPNKYPSPDQANEWDINGDPNKPDTYFEGDDADVIGAKLVEALKSMIAKVSSGTAASILANSEGSGANLLQAIFYPNKIFDSQTEANWTGELHNLWYYIDPFVTRSTVREDTDYTSGNYHYLNLKTDKVVNYYFDGTKTLASLALDTNGDGAADTTPETGIDTDAVKSLWRAGRKLWARDPATRNIYTACTIKNGVCLPCLDPSGCPGGISNSGLMTFTDSYKATFGNYLQAADDATSATIINYVRGTDQGANYRSRTVTLASPAGTNVWKLGDIISSTPRLESSIRLNTYDLPKPTSYGDTSYGNNSGGSKTGFIYSDTYQNRGMVFAGANDGMLHAFRLGVLDVKASGDKKATLSGENLGEEAWAFLPSSTLPYLKYMTDKAYGDKFHLNYVDGTTVVADVSIGISAGCTETTDYWKCDRDFINGTNWRTVVIGSMGTGGATRIKEDTVCAGNCVNTPILDPKDTSKGFGYSSYFALDVTNPEYPTLLWEFSHPELGFATSGPAIVKLATRDSSGNVLGDKNGRWFAVFASGPTGPIADTQFHGRSAQPLKVFVVDLKTGALMTTIDKVSDNGTQIALKNAFAGSIFNNVTDTDRGPYGIASDGLYQDDVVHIGYVQANNDPIDASTTWTQGGLLRLVTGEKLNADGTLDTTNGWKLSKVIDGIGPVTTNLGKIIDRKNHNLWFYFGTGRYYDSGDDRTGQQSLYGIKEPCYKPSVTHADGTVTKDDIDDNNCTTKLARANLDDQTTSPSQTLGLTTDKGWYIDLDLTCGTLDAERVLTDPVITLNGVIYFTSFKPTSDVCSFGGESNLWAVGYDNGAAPPSGRVSGKALIQLSTGSFTEVDLSKAFSAKEGRRTTTPLLGKPPGDAMPLISNSQNRPVKKVLHIREK